jgi:hypothetical protein
MSEAPEGMVRVVACRDMTQAKWLKERYAAEGVKFDDWQFITHEEASAGTSAIWHRMAGKNVEVAIDNLEVFIGRHVRSNVRVVAMEGSKFEERDIEPLPETPYVPKDVKKNT